jgi:hypothetical protein
LTFVLEQSDKVTFGQSENVTFPIF